MGLTSSLPKHLKLHQLLLKCISPVSQVQTASADSKQVPLAFRKYKVYACGVMGSILTYLPKVVVLDENHAANEHPSSVCVSPHHIQREV